MDNYINTLSLSLYLSIPTRLLPDTWDYNRHRLIIGLHYSLHTNINLNLITANLPGFKPRSPGPKVTIVHCSIEQTLLIFIIELENLIELQLFTSFNLTRAVLYIKGQSFWIVVFYDLFSMLSVHILFRYRTLENTEMRSNF